MMLYLTGHLEPTLRRFLKPAVSPEEAKAGSVRVLGKECPVDRVEAKLWSFIHTSAVV
jgi:hypothetical protein